MEWSERLKAWAAFELLSVMEGGEGSWLLRRRNVVVKAVVGMVVRR